MNPFERSHVADETLLHTAPARNASIRDSTAHLLADIGEIGTRKLYRPAGYKSLRRYCVEALEMDDDTARRHIHAAHIARRFPAVFPALADRTLYLTAVIQLSRHLTPENAEGLIAAARGKSKLEIQWLLAERFPKPGTLSWTATCAPERIFEGTSPLPEAEAAKNLPSPVPVAATHAPAPAGNRSWVEPLDAETCEMHFPVKRSALERLQYLQELLGDVPAAQDIGEIFDQSLEARIQQLEKRMFASTANPRNGCHRSANPRYIPAPVKRLVVKRDGKQCTFVSDAGHRCSAKGRLEFDHILEFARGGESTVDNLRLRCRAHNQYEAERTFGAEFMRHKREAARERADESQARNGIAKREEDPDRDVTPWLRALGYRGDQLRRGEEFAAAIPDAPLEQRVRYALSGLTRARRGQPSAA